MSKTSFTVLIDSVDVSNDVKQIDIFLRENAISNAIITLNDTYSKTFDNAAQQGDVVRINITGKGTTEREVFGGYVADLEPSQDLQGNICTVQCFGYGIALSRMRVVQEYGTQSTNQTIDTVREMITDATVGIIPNYVNDTLDSGTASGYSIQTASGGDNYIENEATSLKYVYAPYMPADKVLNQICDLISADNYTDEGIHWQVIPSGGTPYLCVSTVNNHAAPVTDLWPNDTDIGDLYEGEYCRVNLTKKAPEANYIVYFAKFQKPAGESATEGATPHSQWTATLGAASTSATAIVGSASVLCSTGAGCAMYWPSTGMSLDTSKIGTTKTIPYIEFYLQRNSNANAGPTVLLETGAASSGDYFYHTCTCTNADEWYHFKYPIGPNYASERADNFYWSVAGTPDWTDIDRVWFTDIGAANSSIYVDGFTINGIVTRGAKSNTSISAIGAKIKLITDSLAVDDNFDTTDTGTASQLAKAELIRAKTTPISGTVTIPLSETLRPGQIQQIYAKKKIGGTYQIDDEFRILEVQHTITKTGGLTTLTVTDDIINGIAQNPTNSYNILMKAVNPDFQNRLSGSLKARDIDILQDIVEVNYA